MIPLLEKAGYSTYPVSLVSTTAKSPVPDWSGDVEVVRSTVDSLLQSRKNVIVVLFSYTDVVGCEALKKFHNEHHEPLQTHDNQTGSTDDSKSEMGCFGTKDASISRGAARFSISHFSLATLFWLERVYGVLKSPERCPGSSTR